MNFRDHGTRIFMDIQRIRMKLDDIQNCGDLEEAIADVSEISSELHDIEQDLNESFELNMEEE